MVFSGSTLPEGYGRERGRLGGDFVPAENRIPALRFTASEATILYFCLWRSRADGAIEAGRWVRTFCPWSGYSVRQHQLVAPAGTREVGEEGKLAGMRCAVAPGLDFADYEGGAREIVAREYERRLGLSTV